MALTCISQNEVLAFIVYCKLACLCAYLLIILLGCLLVCLLSRTLFNVLLTNIMDTHTEECTDTRTDVHTDEQHIDSFSSCQSQKQSCFFITHENLLKNVQKLFTEDF